MRFPAHLKQRNTDILKRATSYFKHNSNWLVVHHITDPTSLSGELISRFVNQGTWVSICLRSLPPNGPNDRGWCPTRCNHHLRIQCTPHACWPPYANVYLGVWKTVKDYEIDLKLTNIFGSTYPCKQSYFLPCPNR